MAAAMKLGQESNSVSEATFRMHTADSEHLHGSADMQSALLARSSRSTSHERANASAEDLDESLDAVVSAKFFGGFVDAITSVGNALADAGEAIGSAVGNSAMVVGNRIIQPPKLKWSELGDFRDDIESIGSDALTVARVTATTARDVGEIAVEQTIALAKTTLEHARKTAEQGAKIATKVGNFIAEKAVQLGEGVEKVGPLAAGLGPAAWNTLKSLVSCVWQTLTLCHVLIGKHCDCSGGSYVSLRTDRMKMRCVFRATSEFSKAMGVYASQKSNGKTSVLPGQDYAPFEKAWDDVLKSRRGLKEMQKAKPPGMCETELKVAVDGVTQWSPDVTATVYDNGDTVISISGDIRGSYDTLVTGQGSCSYKLRRGFPPPPEGPITRKFCAGGFCVMISLEMVIELVGKGVLTGTIDMSNEVDFQISATVTANKNGETDVQVSTLGMKHKEAVKIGASAEASLRLSAGPELVVWPMPGIPITFLPKFHAEAKAKGMIQHPPSSLLLDQESVRESSPWKSSNASLGLLESKESRVKPPLPQCGAAAVSLYADFVITGFALPMWLKEWLNDSFLKQMIKDAMKEGAEAMIELMKGPATCVPFLNDATQAVTSAALEAGNRIANLMPELTLKWDFLSILLLKPQKLFCKEIYTTPNFENSPCADQLGCGTAGQGPPDETEVEMVPPEQVPAPIVRRPTSTPAPSCGSLRMGDRFIELGKFRIAEIDASHLSISHKDTRKVAAVWHKDGNAWRTHKSDWGKYDAWGRSVGSPGKTIQFGFEFIQIGNFRLGAVDERHFSISHTKAKKTSMVLRGDGHQIWGSRSDYNTLDRSEGAPAGISYGDKWIQIGEWRLGDSGGNDFAFMHPETNATTGGKAIEVYTSAGGFRTGSALVSTSGWGDLLGRHPAHWTCLGIADIAHGTCSEDFGSGWGDRFVQLGDWRLGAIDEDNFAFVHKNGKNSEIFKSDGHRVTGRFSDRLWRRPLGFPHGITFGQNFIQIGSFRLTDFDGNHMSLSHQSHQTPQTWRGHDASLWPKLNSIWNAWRGRDRRTAGPPAGVGYGDRYLQLGRFRIGVADAADHWLFVTHTDDGDGRVMQAWKSDGTVHGGRRRRNWSPDLNRRNIQWHCGNIQSKLGSCSGITAGPGFIQFGDWRMAAVDKDHFSVSHISRLSSVIYRSDGTAHYGPFSHNPPSKNGWDNRESGYVPAGDLQEVKIGNRFIEFGKFWRVGELNAMLSISHSSGQTPLVFQKDGTLIKGPSTANNLFIQRGEPQGVNFGDRFVQIGNFRLGDVDGWHFSISHVENGTLLDLFTGDGLRHLGNGREMYKTTVGRPLQDCKIFTEKPRLFSFDTLYAFYNPWHKRYLSLNSAADMTSVEVSSGPSDLPYTRAHERFSVVDAGNGLVALHNAKNNRFMMMEGTEMMASPRGAANRLKTNWVSVKFEIVDAGDGMVGLHSPFHNRLAQMHSDGTVRATRPVNAQDLPLNSHWHWERFYMVPVQNYLQPGTMVGLWNPTARRFLQMDSGRVETTGQLNADFLEDRHAWERFRVVDAGNGMVALHNYDWNRYVRMIWNGQQHAITVSSVSPDTSVELPNGWASSVAFVPVPINTGNNEIALWHPGHSRAIQMEGHVVSPSRHCQAHDLNSGWAAATFRVVLLKDPTLT